MAAGGAATLMGLEVACAKGNGGAGTGNRAQDLYLVGSFVVFRAGGESARDGKGLARGDEGGVVAVGLGVLQGSDAAKSCEATINNIVDIGRSNRLAEVGEEDRAIGRHTAPEPIARV